MALAGRWKRLDQREQKEPQGSLVRPALPVLTGLPGLLVRQDPKALKGKQARPALKDLRDLVVEVEVYSQSGGMQTPQQEHLCFTQELASIITIPSREEVLNPFV